MHICESLRSFHYVCTLFQVSCLNIRSHEFQEQSNWAQYKVKTILPPIISLDAFSLDLNKEKGQNRFPAQACIRERAASQGLRHASLAVDLIWGMKSEIVNEFNIVWKLWSRMNSSSCSESRSHRYGHFWDTISIKTAVLSLTGH